MAMARGAGSGGKSRWAYFNAKGYHNPSTGAFITAARFNALDPHARQAFRPMTKAGWVQVGSDRFKRLTGMGLTARQQVTANFRPGSKYERVSVKADVQQNLGTVGATRQAADKAGTHKVSPQGIHVTSANPPSGPGQGGRRSVRGGGDTRAQRAQNNAAMSGLLGNPNGIGQMMPRSMANQLAGLQFDPSIAQTRLQIGEQGATNAQDLHDIANWYGQAQQGYQGAGQADQAAAHGAADAQSAAVARLIAATGGAAGGGQLTAAEGANNAGFLLGLGQVADQGAQGMAGNMIEQGAGASAAQNAMNNDANVQLQSQLSQLLGQRGQAQDQALQQIMQYNLGVSQQRFSDRLAKMNAIVGAQAAASNLTTQGLQNKLLQRQVKGSGSAGGFTPWGQMSGSDRNNAIQSWLGLDSSGKATRSPQQALHYAASIGYGKWLPQIGQALSAYTGQ